MPYSASIATAWRLALRQEGARLSKYNRCLTGKVSAMDRHRLASMPVWMTDPVSVLTKHSTKLDTLIFFAERTLFDRIFGIYQPGFHRVGGAPRKRGRAFDGRQQTRRGDKRHRHSFRRHPVRISRDVGLPMIPRTRRQRI